MRYVINNVKIFDGTGSASAPGSIVVEGAKIAQISADSTQRVTEETQIIDGRGGTLMPGLVESHAHLSWPSSIEKIYHEFVLPPDEMKVATWRNARVLLDQGFTSAYSAGSLGDVLEVELRREIEAGRTSGPRLRASTLERSPEAEDGIETGDIHHGRGPDAMRDFVQHCKDIGVDSIKLVISGESALKPGSSHEIFYSDEEVRAASEAARAEGIWVNAHTYTPRAIRMAVENGIRAVYHCAYADEATLDLMEAHKNDIFTGPAVGVLVGTLEVAPPPHIDMSAMKDNARHVIDHYQRLVPEMRRRGIRVLIGGDYGFPFNPNGTNARDLEHFVKLFGYTPAEALVAATKLGGEIMGMGDKLGLIKPGYLADLLLVDGDPTKNISVLQDASRLKMIMQNGRLHKFLPWQDSTAPGQTEAIAL